MIRILNPPLHPTTNMNRHMHALFLKLRWYGQQNTAADEERQKQTGCHYDYSGVMNGCFAEYVTTIFVVPAKLHKNCVHLVSN